MSFLVFQKEKNTTFQTLFLCQYFNQKFHHMLLRSPQSRGAGRGVVKFLKNALQERPFWNRILLLPFFFFFYSFFFLPITSHTNELLFSNGHFSSLSGSRALI